MIPMTSTLYVENRFRKLWIDKLEFYEQQIGLVSNP